MTRGTAQGRYAKMLLERGVPYEEILSDSAMEGFNPATLRTIAKRVRDAKETNETRNETRREANETGKNTDSANEGKNAILATENPVSPVSETRNAVSFWRKIVSQFSLMHLVFYVTTATGCYAIYDTLPNIIGAALLTIFGLFSLDSILKAQDSARPEIAAYGRNRVIFSELIAAIAHYTILNKYLWQNLKSLPFEVRYLPPVNEPALLDLDGKMTNGVWQNGEVIFTISITISGLIFAAAFAAVDSVLRENKANELEATHK